MPHWSLILEGVLSDFHYVCSECGKILPGGGVHYLCPVCSVGSETVVPLRGVLEVHYDYSAIANQIDHRDPDFQLFSPVESRYYPIFPVGHTPLIRAENLEAEINLSNIFLKNEGQNPTGSLKDRASFLVVAQASLLGEEQIVTASTGNAASALAAVCAAASKRAIIYVPASAPKAKLTQSLLYGADVRIVAGTYDDAFSLSLEHTRTLGGLNRNTAYHPFTIEGKKTVSFEIFTQLGKAPDYVFVPMGDGVIISAVYKGFRDLQQVGLVGTIPRLIGVQGGTSHAIFKFLQTGCYRHATEPKTIADSISVARPSNAHMAKNAIEKSGGFSLLVSDQEILSAQKILARTTGIFAEPAAAASIAGLARCAGKIDPMAVCVAIITGNGLKDIDAAMTGLRFPLPTWSPK